MESASLLVVSLAPAAEADRISSCLAQTGLPVLRALRPEQAQQAGARCVVVYVVDRGRCAAETLGRLVASAPARPRLGVLLNCAGQWSARVAELFDEFVGWPCEPWEFISRIQRLLRRPAAVHPAPEPIFGPHLIGRSPAFLQALRILAKLATCNAPVLIEGETGTGKELAAHGIHYQGPRRDYPFIPVNCGALPEQLVENELFGHERGAFTDARTAQEGLVAQAAGGTLFLDEIEALSPRGQVALLRFLQEQEYRPLGARGVRHSDARVIAASNASLADLVSRGGFRQDLYYRLNIMSVTLPPLRTRGEDVLLLADHFLRQFGKRYGQPGRRLHPDVLAWLLRHDWPGNVRELENLVHRGFLLAEGDTIHLPPPSSMAVCETPTVPYYECATFNDAKAQVLEAFEREYLRSMLARTRGNVSEAARQAGKERRALGKLIKKHRIDRDSYL